MKNHKPTITLLLKVLFYNSLLLVNYSVQPQIHPHTHTHKHLTISGQFGEMFTANNVEASLDTRRLNEQVRVTLHSPVTQLVAD